MELGLGGGGGGSCGGGMGGGGGGEWRHVTIKTFFCYVRINLHCTFKLKLEMINNTM